MVDIQPAQAFDFPQAWAFYSPRKDEVDVDEVVTDPVHAGEAHLRHEGHASLRRRDVVRAAFPDQCDEALEQIATDVALTAEELLEGVGTTGMGQVLRHQLRATARAFPERSGSNASGGRLLRTWERHGQRYILRAGRGVRDPTSARRRWPQNTRRSRATRNCLPSSSGSCRASCHQSMMDSNGANAPPAATKRKRRRLSAAQKNGSTGQLVRRRG